MPTPPPPGSPEDLRNQIYRMGSAYWISQIVHTAATLRVGDEFPATGSARADEIAPRLGLNPRNLHRLFRALAAVELLTDEGDGRFSLTALGRLLRSDEPGNAVGFLLMAGQREHFAAWGELSHSIRTGETAFDHAFGKPVFEHLAGHPDAARVFDDAMANNTAATAAAAAAAYPFDRFRTIVDVGGGLGTLLAAILARHEGPRGVVADAPAVVERARAWLSGRGLLNRVDLAGIDFFVSVPSGGDAYLLKSILHDWDDDKAVAILGNVRRAMRPDATLLLLELVLGSDDPRAYLMDLNMMVMTGGCERSEAEWRALLARAGFRLDRVVPTQSASSIIEARVADGA